MMGARSASAILVTLFAGGCEEPSPSGAELASQVVQGAAVETPPEQSGEAAPDDVEAAEEPIPQAPPEAITEEAAPAGPTHPQGEEYLSELTVKVDEGESRATVDQIARTVGATVTTALEEHGIYLLHIDVDTTEERDAIIERIAAESGIREARASRSGYRGRGEGARAEAP